MSNTTTVKGNMGRAAELRFTQSGKAVLGFSLADTPRRRNDAGEWEDAGETLWLDVSVWGDDAEALADQMQNYRGRVTVTGRLGMRSYEARDGSTRQVVTLTADSVALHPKPQGPRQQDGWGAQNRPQSDVERSGVPQHAPDAPRPPQPHSAPSGWGQGGSDEPPF